MSPRSTKDAEKFGPWNMIGSEDTLTNQSGQNPLTARRVLSLIPDISGELSREGGQAKYLPTQIGSPSKVGAIVDYAWNSTAGVRNSDRFAATSTSLYKEVAGVWVVQ